MPEVSVIINCHNGEPYLREAIESVYRQTYGGWEIVLWDDASTDGSEGIAKSFDEKLRYFKGEKAISLGQARNWALEQARGDFIAILDQDDLWMPDKLELQLPLFEKNPRVGLVFSDAVDLYEPSGKRISHFQNLNLRPPRGYIFEYLFVIDHYPISMPTAVFRTEALRSLSEWFDIRYRYAEEYDLFLRLAHDWECDYVDKPLAVHRIHDSSSTSVFHDAIATELASIQEKLLSLYPDIKERLKKEILKNRQSIDLQQAKSLLRRGKKKQARKILLKHISNYKCLITLFSTFLPANYARQLYNVYHESFRGNLSKLTRRR